MRAPVVRAITAADARPIRQAVLRPGAPPETNTYPADDAPDTFHAGAFVDEQLVGIATLLHNPPPGETGAGDWQLRGMAVLPQYQGRGLGRALVRACQAAAQARGGTRLWCNGRVSAVGFYEVLGFERRGEIFDTPYSGPHYQLHMDLNVE